MVYINTMEYAEDLDMTTIHEAYCMVWYNLSTNSLPMAIS